MEQQQHPRSSLVLVVMAKPLPTLLGRVAGWITPNAITHQKVAGSGDIQTHRATITILTDKKRVLSIKEVQSIGMSGVLSSEVNS